jgi:hypothetical protein
VYSTLFSDNARLALLALVVVALLALAGVGAPRATSRQGPGYRRKP